MAAIPVWIWYAATALSAGVAAYSSIQAGKTARAVANMQANAQQETASTTYQQSRYEADTIARRNERVRAQQRAGFLKNGFVLGGSAEDVIYDSAIEGELNVLEALYKGQVGYRYYQTEARITRVEGAARSTAYNYQAAGTILGGVSDMASIANRPRIK